MAGLREAQKKMTRRLILSTALQLFEEKGYAATTVDDIATAAGTTRVTFYAHFPSRSDLVRALIEELNETLGRSDSPTHGSTAPALVEVVADGSPAALTGWLEATARDWDTVRPYTRAASEAAVVDPELRGVVDAWLDEATADVREGLDRADRFDPGSRRLRGVLAISQLDHLARNWEPGRWDRDRDQVVALLAESWHALLGDAGAP